MMDWSAEEWGTSLIYSWKMRRLVFSLHVVCILPKGYVIDMSTMRMEEIVEEGGELCSHFK